MFRSLQVKFADLKHESHDEKDLSQMKRTPYLLTGLLSGLRGRPTRWARSHAVLCEQSFGNSQPSKRRMIMRRIPCFLTALALVLMLGATASAANFSFTTGDPDGRMAAASRPESRGKIEIEAADDFILTLPTVIDRATFTGLLFHGGHGEIRDVVVEIYRVFSKDSDTSRCLGDVVTCSTVNVPARKNSPSDEAFKDRSSADGTLRFTATVVNPHFQVANSVIDGIHPLPDQHTGGDGPVARQEGLLGGELGL